MSIYGENTGRYAYNKYREASSMSITPPDSKNQMGLVKEKQFSYISPID
jgi:hypothetical protein